jgi:hypothetical protein
MGHGESQIGYLANNISLPGGDAPRPALTHRHQVIAYKSRVVGAGDIDPREREPSKFNGRTHRIPNADGVTANDSRMNEGLQPGEVEYSARECCIDAASVEGEGALREVGDRSARTGREGSL